MLDDKIKMMMPGAMTQTCGIPVSGNIDFDKIKNLAVDPPPKIKMIVNKYLPPGTIMISEDVFASLTKK